MARKASTRRGFGQITKMRSGRFQARYTGPSEELVTAPSTFTARIDAEAWLAAERKLVEDPSTWVAPRIRLARAEAKRPRAFAIYAEDWIKGRRVKGQPLADRTIDNYHRLLELHINPTFAQIRLDEITRDMVDAWYDRVAPGSDPTRAHAYALLRGILNTAVERGLIPMNPAVIRGGGRQRRQTETRIATPAEIAAIRKATPERRRLMIDLAAWCGLRFGEVAELRRKDIDTKRGLVRVRRAVVHVRVGTEHHPHGSEARVKAPKSAAGVRDVHIPKALMPAVREHLLKHAAPGSDGLLFPANHGGHLTTGSVHGQARTVNPKTGRTRAGWGFAEAARAAGRPDLRFHDLRHTGLTLAAQTGATLAELMAMAGHSSAKAALIYQHATDDRMRILADRLSALVELPDAEDG